MAWDKDVDDVGTFLVKTGLGVGAVLVGIAALTGKCKRDAPLINYDKNVPAQETGINNTYNGQTTINNTYVNGNNNNVRQNNTVNSTVRSNNNTGSHNTQTGSPSSKVPQKAPRSVPSKSIDDTVSTPVSQAMPEFDSKDIMKYAGFRNGSAYFENGCGEQVEINEARYDQVFPLNNGTFVYAGNTRNYLLNDVPPELRQIIFENGRAIDNQLRNDPFAPTIGRIRNVPDSRGVMSSMWSGRAMNRMNSALMIQVMGGRTYMHPNWNYMGGAYFNGRH